MTTNKISQQDLNMVAVRNTELWKFVFLMLNNMETILGS